jgi:hypothetical protein
MSIATDEAEQEYPVPTDADDPMCKYLETIAGYPAAKRQGYVAGRMAELTEAEVNAAITEWDGHGYCCREGDPIVCMCGARITDDHWYDVHLVRAMLEAARKAVAE